MTAHPSARWSVRLVVAALALGAGLVAPSAAVAADDPADRLTFGIGPADRPTAEAGRAVFTYGLTPGSVAYDRAAVVNYAAAPETFEVYAADAVNADDGSFALTDPGAALHDAGAWMSPRGVRRVTVPGRGRDGRPGRVVVPFTVTAPADAEPGDHAGAIVVSLTSTGRTGTGPTVDLVQRVAARAYVRVDGPATPGLAVARLDARWNAPTWPWQTGSIDVDYAIVNTGNVRLGVQPGLRVSGPATGARTRALAATTELLPHSEVNGRTTIEGVWPTGPLTVEMVATPRAAVAAGAPSLAPVARTTDLWALAWWPLVVLVLVAALVLAAAALTRRHRAARARARHGRARPAPPRAPVPGRLVGTP